MQLSAVGLWGRAALSNAHRGAHPPVSEWRGLKEGGESVYSRLAEPLGPTCRSCAGVPAYVHDSWDAPATLTHVPHALNPHPRHVRAVHGRRARLHDGGAVPGGGGGDAPAGAQVGGRGVLRRGHAGGYGGVSEGGCGHKRE